MKKIKKKSSRAYWIITKNILLYNLIRYIFIFSMVGWLSGKSILHIFSDGTMFVNRGVLLGSWLPIYGSGGI